MSFFPKMRLFLFSTSTLPRSLRDFLTWLRARFILTWLRARGMDVWEYRSGPMVASADARLTIGCNLAIANALLALRGNHPYD